MENILIENEPQNEITKRPQFLTVLCILSFIWTGLILLCLVFCLVFSSVLFNAIGDILSGAISLPTLDEQQEKGLQALYDIGQNKFVAIIAGAIILYMTSLLGVFKMWKQQKWGFYIYAIINVLGAAYDISSGSYFMAMLSLAFIAMYFSNFKFLR